ncbi:hypothetical protein CERSUDRAFT_74219 [Gelatoporia subvermispora B]|uniref:Uncharacterized protein n=1 Tax=Ceriporiopsis subvermispora (strain B) TaxID=914234 RepID=M2QVP9_CERS8|nr:hypothetical protein CERSUDRAFT_74219 [Gelatoporia subvermispora B]
MPIAAAAATTTPSPRQPSALMKSSRQRQGEKKSKQRKGKNRCKLSETAGNGSDEEPEAELSSNESTGSNEVPARSEADQDESSDQSSNENGKDPDQDKESLRSEEANEDAEEGRSDSSKQDSDGGNHGSGGNDGTNIAPPVRVTRSTMRIVQNDGVNSTRSPVARPSSTRGSAATPACIPTARHGRGATSATSRLEATPSAHRTSRAAAGPAPPVLDLSGCPPHTRHLYSNIVEASVRSAAWADCISLFLDFEQANNFADVDQRLPGTEFRLIEFRDWFQAGREKRRPDGPLVDDLAGFKTRMLSWWKSLQPAERGGDLERPSTEIPADSWTAMRRHGKQGIYLVIKGLQWWAWELDKQDDPQLLEDWEFMVSDVAWVLGIWMAE